MPEKDDNTRQHIPEFKWIDEGRNPEPDSDRFPSRSDLAVQNEVGALDPSKGVICASRVAIRQNQRSASTRKFGVRVVVFDEFHYSDCAKLRHIYESAGLTPSQEAFEQRFARIRCGLSACAGPAWCPSGMALLRATR
ncbi:hypothetical protein [Bradyrhizobium sp. CCBAU 21360]|uniref:hypothetical protein n=1 Tax=Bradyrhizobium sp. CCBAU 21360 TaxID=1325081 RepID=UPI002305482E|nr:hypothetical protein [Bradyrhizobium sp. CCBAU 21360]